MNPLGGAVTGLLLLIAVVPCEAADISVASSPGMKEVLDVLGPKFENLSGYKVSVQYLIPGPLRSRMESGELFDVLIVSAELLDALINDGKVAAGSSIAIGRVGMPSNRSPPPSVSMVLLNQALAFASPVVFSSFNIML